MVNIAGIGKSLKTTAEVIGVVTTIVGNAENLQKTIQPALESDDAKAAVEKGKKAFDGLIKKASAAKGSAGVLAGKAADVKDSLVEARKAKKEEKELAKQLKDARQFVLESASQKIAYKDYLRFRNAEGAAADAVSAGLYGGAGCYVFATYGTFDFDKDLTDYLYIHIGKGEKLGDAIGRASSRDGDPDVYADVKYKQNVHVYAYPCTVSELDSKFEALQSLFLCSEPPADFDA